MNNLTPFTEIKTFIFDVDGVFTDSTLLVTENGELLRKMSVRDGFAIKLALRSGYDIVIITGGTSLGVDKRLRSLGIQHIYSGIQDKLTTFKAHFGYPIENKSSLLYMGDDYPDWEIMEEVGLATCPADAEPAIQQRAQYISPHCGGQGCVRDVIEKTMRIQQKWPFV
jgi:3-deoxy-D-manno-octulosonate 8-phosphate phosphatase (KDO 8-P phosphatase)